jgi:hypothetical protein
MATNIPINARELQNICRFSVKKQFYLYNFSGFSGKFRRDQESRNSPDFERIVIVITWMSYMAQFSGLIGILVITTYNSWAPQSTTVFALIKLQHG